jgi:hypothetical protein
MKIEDNVTIVPVDDLSECKYDTVTTSGTTDYTIDWTTTASKGWVCPVCGRGVAPWISVCPCVPTEYGPYIWFNEVKNC